MKRNVIFAAIFAIAAFAVSASAQKADFSGTWNLDASKSKPAEQMIESQTLVVTQTATDLKVERTTKMKADAQPMRGGGNMGDGPTTYSLDGKAVESEIQGRGGAMKVTTSAKIDGGHFVLTRTIATPMGDRSSTEKWSLNADGTLTIESTRPNRDGGTDTLGRTYVKK